jgi:hypothetical protein
MMGIKKTQNFMLISKMQTNLSDKMHLKRVMSQKRSSQKFIYCLFWTKKVDFGLKKEFFSFITFPKHKTN